MRFFLAVLLIAALASLGACELVLGSLPPVKQHDGGAGGAGGAPSTSASSSSSTSSSGGGSCCDCDGDQVLAKGICGGTDCDDHDDRVYPGEPIYYGEPTSDPTLGFDWDCSGTAEQDPTLLKTVDCGVIGLPCAAGTGFLAKVPPACGESAPWGSCMQDGLGCVPAVVEQAKVMTCK